MSKRGRKPEFNPTGQMYMELIDSTANTEHVLEAIRKRWGTDYMLVNSDGIELEDSAATRGMYIHIQYSYSYILCMLKLCMYI